MKYTDFAFIFNNKTLKTNKIFILMQVTVQNLTFHTEKILHAKDN